VLSRRTTSEVTLDKAYENKSPAEILDASATRPQASLGEYKSYLQQRWNQGLHQCVAVGRRDERPRIPGGYGTIWGLPAALPNPGCRAARPALPKVCDVVG
jgi:hypothetical protein